MHNDPVLFPQLKDAVKLQSRQGTEKKELISRLAIIKSYPETSQVQEYYVRNKGDLKKTADDADLYADTNEDAVKVALKRKLSKK